MNGNFKTDLGDIYIDPKVIATYAGSVVGQCFGIVGMAWVNVKDGVVSLLRRESWTKGINVEIKDNKLFLDFHVIVSYGVNIPMVMNNLISDVNYRLRKFTSMEIGQINIYVEGVRVID